VALYKKADIKVNSAYITKKSENKVSASEPVKNIKDSINTKGIKANTGKK
jgi:hypothetical protein